MLPGQVPVAVLERPQRGSVVTQGTAPVFPGPAGVAGLLVVPTFLPPEGGGCLWWAGGDRPTIGVLPGNGARPSNGWHSFLLASLPREGAVNPTCNFVGVLGHQRSQLQSGGGRESLNPKKSL